VLHHFTTVAAASDLPVMLYDVPGRTGQAIAMETYEAAMAIDTVTSVKHATGDPTATVQLRQLGYDVYSGDDSLILGYLAHGACGLISVVGHAAGRQLSTLISTFLSGDHESALQEYIGLKPAFDAVMGVTNYGATTAKASLQLLGVLDNRFVRGPLVPLTDDEVAALKSGLESAGLL
jgi:4-hydroxy-tetrahydrodipicolinate synthase